MVASLHCRFAFLGVLILLLSFFSPLNLPVEAEEPSDGSGQPANVSEDSGEGPANDTATDKPATDEKEEPQGDEVILVGRDDPEMVAAIKKARASLPAFWQRFSNPGANEESFLIKVMISDAFGVEHFWCGRLKKEGDEIECTIANEPHTVRIVEFGQVIHPEQSQISDWMFRKNGYIHGNFTMRVLINRMPPEKAEYYKSMLGQPEIPPREDPEPDPEKDSP